MIIRTLDVQGFSTAIYAMRSPMDSWSKSDSYFNQLNEYVIGEKDKELSIKLQTAGPEHCKHLRMIQAWAEISAPREWLIQLDTYRFGVEKISSSTMHTLMRRPLDKGDFEHDCLNDEYLNYVLDAINTSMEAWRYEKDPEFKKQIWRGIIESLPQSFIQKRIYMFSYAALRNIVRQREGHKLDEWNTFISWCKTLPENWMIFE